MLGVFCGLPHLPRHLTFIVLDACYVCSAPATLHLVPISTRLVSVLGVAYLQVHATLPYVLKTQ